MGLLRIHCEPRNELARTWKKRASGRGPARCQLPRDPGPGCESFGCERVMDELHALADCWHFEIEIDAPIGSRWEWHESLALLRVGVDATPSDLAWICRLAVRRLLTGSWMTLP